MASGPAPACAGVKLVFSIICTHASESMFVRLLSSCFHGFREIRTQVIQVPMPLEPVRSLNQRSAFFITEQLVFRAETLISAAF